MSAGPRLDENLVPEERGLLRGWWGSNRAEGQKSPHGELGCGTVEMNPTSLHEDVGLIPSLAQCLKDPVLPWLWYRLAAAALVRPLAWELPYVSHAVLKNT